MTSSTKNKTRAVEKTTKKNGKKVRAKFRPSYRERCTFSFLRSLNAMQLIHEWIEEDEVDAHWIGMEFIACYKWLSHSIEMLCKAVLYRRSKYLVLESYDLFNSLIPNEKNTELRTCGAIVSLARASKLLKMNISNEQIMQLKRAVDARNQSEHGEFYITNFVHEMHQIVSVYNLVVDIYNEEFRNGDLIEDTGGNEDGELKEFFDRMLDESSLDFQKLARKVATKIKRGVKFVNCVNCYYKFGELSNSGKEYKCLWCDEERHLIKCSDQSCPVEFWSQSNAEGQTCGREHERYFRWQKVSDHRVLSWDQILQHESFQAALLNREFQGATIAELAGVKPSSKEDKDEK